MMAAVPACFSRSGKHKKAYPSREAARRDLAHSRRWRHRSTWPRPYLCGACHRYHLARAEADE